jgi:hypothetical protein
MRGKIMNERRKTDRLAISHPIIYAACDSKGQIETQGIGLALDISEDGMMFESSEPIEAAKLAIHSSCGDGGTLSVEGYLIYSMPCADGKYRSGVRFKGPAEHVAQFVGELCKNPV